MRLAAPLTAALLARRPHGLGRRAGAREQRRAAEDRGPVASSAPPRTTASSIASSSTAAASRYKPAEPDALSFAIHGEYQLRFQGQSALRLEPPVGQPQASSLGQS